MKARLRFRTILPFVGVLTAALFGGIGLWQRSSILSRPFFENQTMWDTTARFHVWPWPYKFAAILNLPALFGDLLLTIPIDAIKSNLPDAVESAPTLLFAWFLWRWVGSRLDRRWKIADKAPWIALIVFTLVSLVGAFVNVIFLYTGYLPYGFILWTLVIIGLVRHTSKFPVVG
jgi:hypothetical protein